ncbi:MAG: SIS domain-containing protein [Roseiflexaceae bacterium]
MTLRAEIVEQPEVLERLLDAQWPAAQEVAAAIRRRAPAYALIAARGTSGHAGLYAQYLWGAHNRLVVAHAAPALVTAYASAPDMRAALVVGISQSGQSPDIVQTVAAGRAQGALTVAITNDPRSPLARTAEYVLDLGAGVEAAVAATKTYTTQLATVALLSAALSDAPAARLEELRRVPDAVRVALAQEQQIAALAGRYAEMERCILLGRGYSLATAREAALKLKELASVAADPYSSAEFQHGPIALATPGTPVLAVAPQDAVLDDMLPLLRRLTDEREARLVVFSDSEAALALADDPVRLPAGLPAWLGPLVQIIPLQLFAHALTIQKGFDPVAPRGLSKVTLTH